MNKSTMDKNTNENTILTPLYVRGEVLTEEQTIEKAMLHFYAVYATEISKLYLDDDENWGGDSYLYGLTDQFDFEVSITENGIYKLTLYPVLDGQTEFSVAIPIKEIKRDTIQYNGNMIL